ncbi:MAG TPA: hypothetical protein VHB20_07205 [Verrucomicrobiae bacterium]|jgi:hypothetical protein|nr:hypothetical protein [Verrucomicrobiae bacterium]
MILRKILGWSSALCLCATLLQAQETSELEQLRKQVQLQQQQIDQLIHKVDELTKTATPPPAPSAPAAKTEDQKKLEQDLAAELGTNPPAAPAPAMAESAKTAWSPSQPITVARAGSAYMNISFDALLDAGWSTAADPAARLELGDHDPQKRGFSLRNAEIALDGAIDPYFKGFANIVMKLDNNNETSIELEEAYLESTALPANLQLKAGQFFAAFGRNNAQHPHAWAFVDAPVILERVFGPDGLRNLGAQISWLAPTPFYTEFFLGILDGQGSTAFHFRNIGDDDGTGTNRFAGRATVNRDLRGPQDLIYTPRVASSFELGDTQTLVAGLSGAFGPNDTGAHSRTEVYGADLYWKWKPANAAGGFPFVSWQTEGVYGRMGAGADPTAPTPLPAENILDWGGYTQVLWGFTPRWVTGLRGDYAAGNSTYIDPTDPTRGERWRVSPVLTFYPSEFSKIRLQYNFDHDQFIGVQHSVWMQLEFLLGSHSAHKF